MYFFSLFLYPYDAYGLCLTDMVPDQGVYFGNESMLQCRFRMDCLLRECAFRLSVFICVCVCVTSPVKKNLMQKSRLCAQGVRLACHYTSKTPLGGPKKQLVCVISKKSCHHNLLVTELLTNECCR